MLTKLIAANFYRKYVQRSCSSVSKSAETQEEIAASAGRALQLKTLFGMEFAFLFSLLAGMRFFRNPRLEEEERKLREAECVAVVGPSGVGKGTLINMYLQSNDDYELVPSHTTRAPRGSEVNGVHYHFITEEQFRKGIAEDKFIEYNQYGDNLYGTSKDALVKIREKGKIPLLDVDINGCKSLVAKEQKPYKIFVTPPEPQPLKVLEARLDQRGTETPESKKKRLEKAREELAFYYSHPEMFDKVIENDNLRQSFQKLKDSFKEVSIRKLKQFKKTE